MNKDFKSELDAELKSHNTRLSERKREQDEWRAYEDELHAEFKRKCRTIVLPIYKQFSKYVFNSLEWNSSIDLSEDIMMIPSNNGWIKHNEPITVAMMLFFKGEWSQHKIHGAPYFALVCDYRRSSIFFHWSTMPTRKSEFGSGHCGIQLAELTRRETRENLAAFFAQLLRDAEKD